MERNLPSLLLDQYRPTELGIDCAQCRRRVFVSTAVLKAKYGVCTLGEMARRVAASGNPRCELAQDAAENHCRARPIEPEFWTWAKLEDARRHGYTARLRCQRHLAALKRTNPCPEVWDIDVETLMAAYGHGQELSRLQGKLFCPGCGTRSVALEWLPPRDLPAPGGVGARAPGAGIVPLKVVRR